MIVAENGRRERPRKKKHVCVDGYGFCRSAEIGERHFSVFFFFLTRRIAATSRETHRNRGRGQDPVVVVLLAGHRLRLGRQQFEEHQGQRQVDDQYYQHQLLSREPVLQR